MRRGSRLTFLLLAVGALGAVGVYGQNAPQAQPGDVLESRFIGQVSASQARGTISSLFSSAGVPSTPYAVRRYRIRIATRDLQNRPTSVAAMLDVPVRGSSARPAIHVIGAGTTGIADQCAPSKERPSVRLWGDYPAANLAYASAGFVAITPDYLFFDDPQRVQPYFVSQAEAQVMLDAARAVRKLAANGRLGVTPSNSVFLSGYSQGAHAAFAGADFQSRYASDVPVKGVIGFGSTTDVGGLMRQDSRFAPYIMASYRQTYGQGIDRNQILAQRSLSNFAREIANRCVDGIRTYYPTNPKQAFQSEFAQDLLAFELGEDYPELARALQLNNAGFHPTAQDIPALLVQGSADTIVSNAQQRAFANKMCQLERRVRYSQYAGVPHTQTRQFGFRESVTWMNNILNGQSAPSTCSR
jgi:acetyl esterase/lipase